MALVGVWPDQAPTHPPTHPPPRASGAGDDSGRVRAPAGLGGGGAWRRRGGTERRRGVKATPRLRPVIFPPRQCSHPYSLQALPQQQRSAHAHHRSPRVPVLPPPQPPPWAREAPGMSRTRWACGAGPSGTRARIAPRCGGGLDGWPAQSARHTAHAREGGGGAQGGGPPRRHRDGAARRPPACPRTWPRSWRRGRTPSWSARALPWYAARGEGRGVCQGALTRPPAAQRHPPTASPPRPTPSRRCQSEASCASTSSSRSRSTTSRWASWWWSCLTISRLWRLPTFATAARVGGWGRAGVSGGGGTDHMNEARARAAVQESSLTPPAWCSRSRRGRERQLQGHPRAPRGAAAGVLWRQVCSLPRGRAHEALL